MQLEDKTVKFEDGTEFEFNVYWIEAINLKYGFDLPEYFKHTRPYVRDLREKGEMITKFGTMPMTKGMTMSQHFEKCVYADLRAALMGIALRSLDSSAKVIALQGDGTVKEYPSGVEKTVDEAFSDIHE
jgi:hypothetical protein